MNNQFNKESEKVLIRNWEVKNYIESMDDRNNQCEDRTSQLEGNDTFKD